MQKTWGLGIQYLLAHATFFFFFLGGFNVGYYRCLVFYIGRVFCRVSAVYISQEKRQISIRAGHHNLQFEDYVYTSHEQ